MIMEYNPEMRISIKSLLCVGLCVLVCLNAGTSLSCKGYTCGYGTENKCGDDGQCSCSNHFAYRRQRPLFGTSVQFCLRTCDDGNCPANYYCQTSAQQPPRHRCVCIKRYRRSEFGECVESCAVLDCGVGHPCSETDGGALCGSGCVMGYQPHPTNKGVCIDLDECTDIKACPDLPHSRCVNRPGSYLCDCVEGYQTSDTNVVCEDVNECKDTTRCSDQPNMLCVNTPGSFRCDCLQGFHKSDQNQCEDDDECMDTTKCTDKHNTFCVNTPGSFRCDCLPGYNKLVHDQCEDVDECMNTTRCADQHNTLCVNTPGSFRCDCLQGYNKSDNDQCEDVDECMDTTRCTDQPNTLCVNTPGSFRCDCLPGYNKSDNDQCEDINECEEKPSICGENYVCENLPGNYSCLCQDGYMVGNSTCLLIEDKPAGLTDSNGGSPADVSLYVGVTVGVLMVLGLIIGTILIRRRRNSKKLSKGTETESRPKADHSYDNVSLENEDLKRRDDVSGESPNSKVSQNKLDRSQNSISVEYSNHKIPSNGDRNVGNTDCIKFAPQCMTDSDQSEGKGVYSDPYEENALSQNNNQVTSMTSVKNEEPAAFIKSEAFSLGTNNQPNTDQYETKHELSGKVSTLQESDALNNVPPGSFNVLQSNANNTLYSDDYNTLESCNLNATDNMKVGNKTTEDQNLYNVLYDINIDISGGDKRRAAGEDKSDNNCE